MRALLFDLDGTLIDSVPDIAAAVDKTLLSLGTVAAGEDKVRAWVGNGAEMLVRRALLDARQLDEKDLAESDVQSALATFKQYYDIHCCELSRLYEGVSESLLSLSHEYKMAIVTNKPKAFAAKIAKAYGLDKTCSVLIGGECLPTRKPAPEMLYAAAEQLSVDIQDCIMVGDSAADIGAAMNANISCLAVDYGYHRDADLLALGADALFSDFSSVQHYLSDLNR